MKAKYSACLCVLGLLVFGRQDCQAIQLSNTNSLWSEIITSVDRPKDHTKIQMKSKHKAKNKSKKKSKKHKKHKKDDETLIDEADDVEKQEANIITHTVSQKLDQLDASDASLSDMYTFSKVIAQGKTVAEAEVEEKQKVQALAIIEQKKKDEVDKKLEAFNEIEKEEEQKKQDAIDITTRKMLAQQYEKMEIDDERREGIDNGFQSYKVVSDMKAEQDYAINQYKGSGEMSDILDEIKSEAQKQRVQDKQQLSAVNAEEDRIKGHEVTAEKGEGLIGNDAESMYAFSAFAAANAQ